MNDVFEKRVRAAAIAGWWIVVIAVVFLVVQWVAYLAIMHARPACLPAMWGPEISWTFIQNVWFWVMAIFKMSV